jgi:hypothetical protein
LEIEHRVDDIRNFTHPSQGMKLRQLRMITLSVHRRVNDGRRHRVEPDVVRRVTQAALDTYARSNLSPAQQKEFDALEQGIDEINRQVTVLRICAG